MPLSPETNLATDVFVFSSAGAIAVEICDLLPAGGFATLACAAGAVAAATGREGKGADFGGDDTMAAAGALAACVLSPELVTTGVTDRTGLFIKTAFSGGGGACTFGIDACTRGADACPCDTGACARGTGAFTCKAGVCAGEADVCASNTGGRAGNADARIDGAGACDFSAAKLVGGTSC